MRNTPRKDVALIMKLFDFPPETIDAVHTIANLCLAFVNIIVVEVVSCPGLIGGQPMKRAPAQWPERKQYTGITNDCMWIAIRKHARV